MELLLQRDRALLPRRPPPEVRREDAREPVVLVDGGGTAVLREACALGLKGASRVGGKGEASVPVQRLHLVEGHARLRLHTDPRLGQGPHPDAPRRRDGSRRSEGKSRVWSPVHQRGSNPRRQSRELVEDYQVLATRGLPSQTRRLVSLCIVAPEEFPLQTHVRASDPRALAQQSVALHQLGRHHGVVVDQAQVVMRSRLHSPPDTDKPPRGARGRTDEVPEHRVRAAGVYLAALLVHVHRLPETPDHEREVRSVPVVPLIPRAPFPAPLGVHRVDLPHRGPQRVGPQTHRKAGTPEVGVHVGVHWPHGPFRLDVLVRVRSGRAKAEALVVRQGCKPRGDLRRRRRLP